MRRALSRAVAAAVLLLLLVGAPAALLAWGRPPPLDPARWWGVDDGSVLLGLLTAVAWLVWVVLAIAIVVEAVGAVRGRRIRLPGISAVQGLVAALVTVAVLGSIAAPSAAAATPAAPRVAAAAPADAPQPPRVAVSGTAATHGASTESVGTAAAPGPNDLVHEVRAGDDLWSLAERYLGDGMRWRDIVAANPSLGDPDHIEVGWRLVIPGAAPASSGERSRPEAAPPVRSGKPDRPDGPHRPAGTLDPGSVSLPRVAAEPDAVLASVGVGTLLAAGIVTGLAIRRRQRDAARPVGRRFAPPDGPAARLESVLRCRQEPETGTGLERAQRAIAAHCRDANLPHLLAVEAGTEHIRFRFRRGELVGTPPPGFETIADGWSVDRATAERISAPDAPIAYPALLTVGSTADAEVLIDAEEAGTLGLSGTRAPQALAAMLLGLACGPWPDEVRLAVGPELADVVAAAGIDVAVGNPARRRADAAREDRLDPDLADALTPTVAVGLPEACEPRILVDSQAAWTLDVDRGILTTPEATWRLTPERLDEDHHAAVVTLFHQATDPAHEAAPWWSTADADNVVAFPAPRPDTPLDAVWPRKEALVLDPPSSPTLLLLGPVELVGAPGAPPPRAVKQCLEYLGWLLEHPGGTATQMADALIVAEGTRRSNLSRLRAWLGSDPDGEPYLPDAYTGRIRLHPSVSSDWQRLQLAMLPGINRVSADTLAAALDLVRGAPLADAAPGQWHWAEPLRSDIVAMLRDIAAELAERALAGGDVDLVRWATARGLVVAPEDEVLIGWRIRAEHRAGNRPEVERLALRLAHHARSLGVDLRDETVIMLQEVMEGRPRIRRLG